MSKRTLTEWAAIAEIAGTVAIVVSLLFVVYSIQQNTEQLRLQNDNFLYDQQNDALDTMISQPLLLEVLAKARESDQLTATERLRLRAFQNQAANRWEMAYWWHQRGLMSEKDWEDWDQFFRINATGLISGEDWEDMRGAYSEEFASYVDKHFAPVN